MPKKASTGASTSARAPSAATTYTGVNSTGAKTVLVSALLEVTGQLRFGDGTDIATTITEKDSVVGPDGNGIEKAVWAGTKRRGVDRRTIHEFRDRSGWDGKECYIPKLCGMCPTCWLYGFTGTTQEAESEVKGINAKSRILYATSLSVEATSRCLNRHSRNQVNERSQTTAGSAGIHEEEVIVAGTHFPIHTSLMRVLDWEIGVVAHALLENINANRYTAASRGQGGLRVAEHDGEPCLVIDESPTGVFPIGVPKISAWETDCKKVVPLFGATRNSPLSVLSFEALFKSQGFAVEGSVGTLRAKGGNIELLVESRTDFVIVHQGPDELMRRYYGNQAIGYLRQKQVEAQKKLGESSWRVAFGEEIKNYANSLQKKEQSSATPGAATAAASASSDPNTGGENA